MKPISSFFLLITLGLVGNIVSAFQRPLFTKSEMREVNRRLQAIGNL